MVLAESWKRVITDRVWSLESPAVSVDELCSKLEFLPNWLVVVSSDPASLIGNLNVPARSASINLIHVRACVHRSAPQQYSEQA